jgi:hypothetical protein
MPTGTSHLGEVLLQHEQLCLLAPVASMAPLLAPPTTQQQQRQQQRGPAVVAPHLEQVPLAAHMQVAWLKGHHAPCSHNNSSSSGARRLAQAPAALEQQLLVATAGEHMVQQPGSSSSSQCTGSNHSNSKRVRVWVDMATQLANSSSSSRLGSSRYTSSDPCNHRPHSSSSSPWVVCGNSNPASMPQQARPCLVGNSSHHHSSSSRWRMLQAAWPVQQLPQLLAPEASAAVEGCPPMVQMQAPGSQQLQQQVLPAGLQQHHRSPSHHSSSSSSSRVLCHSNSNQTQGGHPAAVAGPWTTGL